MIKSGGGRVGPEIDSKVYRQVTGYRSTGAEFGADKKVLVID